MPAAQLHHDLADLVDLLARGPTVGCARCDPRGELVVKPGHADLEELVQIRREDGQKGNPFEQGDGRILGEIQHPGVEREPAQLTIQHGGVVVIPSADPGCDRRVER